MSEQTLVQEWMKKDPYLLDAEGLQKFLAEKMPEVVKKQEERAKRKWNEILDELMSRNQRRSLEDRAHQEILVKGEQFTQTNAKDFQEGIELLSEIMLAYGKFSEKNGPFGDMFGTYLADNELLHTKYGECYTPMNIVDFMSKMTLGDDLDGEPKTILDPACGTGRFMLGAAKHYAKEIKKLNFIFFNIDIDFRAYVFCALHAILNGIPAVTIWGDSLAMKYREAVATIPVGQVAMWKMLDAEHITDLMIRFDKTAQL